MKHISEIIDDVLTEWAYRVHDGMPDVDNPLHMVQLEHSLNDLEFPSQFIVEFMSNLREKDDGRLDDKEKEKAKKMGLVSLGYGNYGKEEGGETTHKNVDGRLVAVGDDDKDDTAGDPDDSWDDEEGRAKPKIVEPEPNPYSVKKDKDEPKKVKSYQNTPNEILQDKGSDWEIKQKGLEYGYNEIKDENDNTIFKAAPGNAGSMWNEIMSGEVSNILQAEPNLTNEEITKRIIQQFGDTTLAEQNSGKKATAGLGVNKSNSPEEFHDNLELYSKTLNTVKAGRRKHNKAVRSAEALDIKNPKITNFYGHKDSLQAMQDRIDEMPEEANIYSVDKNGNRYEIPKKIAKYLISKSGGGENPSDTATFVTDPKTGNIIMHFHSDKDTLDAITAQSSPNKEYTKLDELIDEAFKNGDVNEGQRDQLKGFNVQHRDALAEIESELKTVQKEAGSFFSKMKSSDLDNVLNNIKGDKDSDGKVTKSSKGDTIEKTSTKWTNATKKKFSLPSPPKGNFSVYLSDEAKENWDNMSDNEKEKEQLRAFFNFMGDSPEERAKKLGKEYDENKPIVSTDKEDALLDRINAKYRKLGSPDTYGQIEEIRQKHAIAEKDHYNNLNGYYIPDGSDIPLGQKMEASTVFDQFHLEAMNPNSKKGVHAYPGLFETNHGGLSVDGSVLRDVFGVDNKENFTAEFSFETQGQLGGSGAMKGRTTGETRNVFLLIKDEEGVEKERIYVGEKRLRTKTGKLGKLQTVYKWHNDAIKKFKEKGHTA